MTQLDLLAGLPEPPADTLEAARERARVFVDALLARRVCLDCCGSERLSFVHRRATRWNVQVWRLVRAGAPTGRIRDEITRCSVLCRRCWLSRMRPQMLRSFRSSPDRLVAKGRSRAAAA